MPTKKKPEAADAVVDAAQATTEAATSIAEAAKLSNANNVLKFRIWEAAIAGIVAVLIAWIQVKTLEAVNAAVNTSNHTASKVDETNLKVEEVKKTGLDTHKLVNSQTLVSAELHLVTCRRLAEITKDPRDIAAAELAEKVVTEIKEKMAKQEAEELKKSKETKTTKTRTNLVNS